MILLYLDPGTGSMIFQMLIAATLGIIFYFKLAKNAAKNFFVGLFSKKQKQEKVEGEDS